MSLLSCWQSLLVLDYPTEIVASGVQEEGEIAISQHELLKIAGGPPQSNLSNVALGEAGVAFVLASATTLPGGSATVRSWL